METNHETINNHCNNRTTAHISHRHVHSTLQTTLIQMMLFVWVTPQRCGRKVDRTLCLCIYGKECRIDRTLYSTLLNSTHFFSVVDRTPTHYFWSTGWEVISKSPSHYSMGCLLCWVCVRVYYQHWTSTWEIRSHVSPSPSDVKSLFIVLVEESSFHIAYQQHQLIVLLSRF